MPVVAEMYYKMIREASQTDWKERKKQNKIHLNISSGLKIEI